MLRKADLAAKLEVLYELPELSVVAFEIEGYHGKTYTYAAIKVTCDGESRWYRTQSATSRLSPLSAAGLIEWLLSHNAQNVRFTIDSSMTRVQNLIRTPNV